MRKSIMVFAPHPDDETLGCGGIIARKIAEGYEVTIIVMTDGRQSLSVAGISCCPTPDELKQIRRKEVEKATKILGVSQEKLIFLDFEDKTLRKNEREAEAKVKDIFEANPPAEIYFPYKKDYHDDHQATNRIVSHSVKCLKEPPLEYQYSIAQKRAFIGPPIAGWALQNKLFVLLKNNLVQIDISKFLPLKKAALMEFKSQLTKISDKQEKPVLRNIERYLGKKETFYYEQRKELDPNLSAF